MRQTAWFFTLFKTLLFFLLGALFFTGIACDKAQESAKSTAQGFKVYERWREGGDKLRSRKWKENGENYRENCHIDPKGKELGCGTMKNGKNWEGFFIVWHSYNKPSDSGRSYYGKPAEILHYHQGRLHGSYRKYYPNGQLMQEIEYQNGNKVHWKSFTPAGIPYHEGKQDRPTETTSSHPEWE